MILRKLLTIAIACGVASSALASKTVLGKLGQVTQGCKIYARPSTGAHVYYRVQAYEYVVIQPKDPNWMKVLLQNGAYGYVPAAYVVKLPYEVTADQATRGNFRGPNISSRTSAGVANYALNFIGTPYVWGGNDPNRGIDCSGLVQQMFGKIGVDLPRTASEQALVGRPVSRLEDLRAGDRLYFWENKRGKIGHTGIYLGKGYFVHSSMTHRGVATDYLGSPKWLRILVAARRS